MPSIFLVASIILHPGLKPQQKLFEFSVNAKQTSLKEERKKKTISCFKLSPPILSALHHLYIYRETHSQIPT